MLNSPAVSILGDFDSFVPPRIGGLGGQNHTHNQQRRVGYLKEEVGQG
ncbi:hypothetical protein LYNGBM3L_37050 [Moorena producens 3L]|uniref:Uncharacterized protein n=1 Tax=Moorena producens 3L TaxID=489825 RepID=F4XQ22_9CYAN|nr:hypothetical protein LYNGBM3L_37050 [Moorena producens 3L]